VIFSEFAGPVVATINGLPVTDLTGWTAACQIRTLTGALIADLVVTWLDFNPATLSLTFAGSTQDWPAGTARIDIQFTTPAGKKVSTKPQTFEIVLDVTRET
jgi:hypothetical protein